MPTVWVILGLIILIAGAEGLIRYSSRLALRLGLSSMMVGLTVVAYGTSMPELVVSLRSAIAGNSAISVGNVIGSNICNLGLILGLCALIHPAPVESRFVRRETPWLLAVSIVATACLWDGHVGRIEGTFFLAGLVGQFLFIWKTEKKEKKQAQNSDESAPVPGRLLPTGFLMVAFLGLLLLGGQLFVAGAIQLATTWGVSEAVIGLTVVAIGTSLPELATSVLAATRGQSDMAIGNVVGSNVFNLLGILGLTAVIAPIDTGGVGRLDGMVMCGFTLALLPMMLTGFRLCRIEGGILLIGYLGYLLYQSGILA